MSASLHQLGFEARGLSSAEIRTVDVAKYQEFLDDSDMTPEQKEGFLQSVLSIVVSFFDLGFDVKALEEPCGKDGETAVPHPKAAFDQVKIGGSENSKKQKEIRPLGRSGGKMISKNNNQEGTCAVIYCRVSSTKQKTEGSGLESQEHRCRQWAAAQGYQVEAVFPDDASGGGDLIKRPGMVALLSYLDAQPDKSYVVIFGDLKRFARDTEVHIKLRREFQQRGARIECLNFKLDDSPEGKFVETIFAAQGELEREQNRRQVIQKMKARVEKGYYVFHPPVGYRYDKDRTHGKLLVRQEPVASIIAEALEGYASGRFRSQVEVKRFLESKPDFPKSGANGYVHPRSRTCFSAPSMRATSKRRIGAYLYGRVITSR